MANVVKLTYYQKNRDSALKKAKEHYYTNKDKINKRLRDKSSNLIEEQKIKRREYEKNWRDNLSEEQKIKARNRYRCLPEEEKNKLREYAEKQVSHIDKNTLKTFLSFESSV